MIIITAHSIIINLCRGISENCVIDWDNVVLNNSEQSVAHGEKVLFKCKKGHINLGERVITCYDGKFLPGDPNCTKVGMYHFIF